MLLTALDVGNQWSLCEFRLAKANSQATSHARTSDIKGNDLLKGRTHTGRLNFHMTTTVNPFTVTTHFTNMMLTTTSMSSNRDKPVVSA